MTSLDARTTALTELLGRGDVLVLSGAGISTDSGIPCYRDPDGAARGAPMTFQRFVGSSVDRRRYWARSHLGWERVANARPNVAHRCVVALERAGLLSGTVTQNVDGLHTAAGSRDVVDLHGRLDVVVCLACGARRPRLEVGLRLDVLNPGFRARSIRSVRPDGDVHLADAEVAGFRLAACRDCGGDLKPDVVYFGEHVPRRRFQEALGRLERSRALVVLGSSLAVGSGYRFVTSAAKRGLPVAIVTRGVTRGDHHATIRIDAPLADVLPEVTSRAARTAARDLVAPGG